MRSCNIVAVAHNKAALRHADVGLHINMCQAKESLLLDRCISMAHLVVGGVHQILVHHGLGDVRGDCDSVRRVPQPPA